MVCRFFDAENKRCMVINDRCKGRFLGDQWLNCPIYLKQVEKILKRVGEKKTSTLDER